MRGYAPVAVLGLALGLGGTVSAGAADLERAPAGNFHVEQAAPARAGMRVIADDQPGVIVRAYWRQPWGHRHFYPATGKRPAVGRDENLAAGGKPPRRAQSFERHWWVSSIFASDIAVSGDRGLAREPSLK